MKNIIITIHGIRTRTGFNWTRFFALHLELDRDSRFKNWLVKRFSYGYLRAVLVAVPWVRKFKVWKFKRYLRKLQKEYPIAKIDILAHSFGTYIAYEAIRQAGKDKKPSIRINKLILVGGIISSHEDFKDTIGEGLIKEIYNYCSYNDRVVRFNPLFGHCGYQGFFVPGKREHIEAPWPGVKNCRFKVRHSQWFDDEPPNFYSMWLDNIIKEG